MRLQVFLSHSGACSRRAALDLIQEGRVKVNNRTINEPSFPVEVGKDSISLNGKNIELQDKAYLLLNKPKGVMTTRKDRHALHTVYEYLPAKFRHLFPVGRLDQDSQGLLLFTNDGELAFRLMHPRFSVEKEYEVKINKALAETDRLSLEKGVVIDAKRTSPAKVLFLNSQPTICQVIIHEGKKRQIRRMFAQLGYRVLALKRLSYGPLRLGNLTQKAWRLLSESEVDNLRQSVALK